MDNKICISIFKDGKDTTTREDFTNIWVRLILSLEKNRYEYGNLNAKPLKEEV